MAGPLMVLMRVSLVCGRADHVARGRMIAPPIALVNIWSDQLTRMPGAPKLGPPTPHDSGPVQFSFAPGRFEAVCPGTEGDTMHIAAHNWMRAEPIRRTL